MAFARHRLTAVLLLLLLAGALRFSGITFDSLWLDESYQTMADAVGRPLPDFITPRHEPYLFRFDKPAPVDELLANFRTVDPLCPPLYAVMLNRWMMVFGSGDLAVRSLSAVLSLASVALVFLLGRLMFGFHAAVLAALVQAVSPLDIIYAQEARMYSLTILSATASCGLLWWCLQSRRPTLGLVPALALYALSTWALINSHYTGLFIPVFQGAFSVIYCLRFKLWSLLAGLAAAWAATLALWMPWFALFRQAASARTAGFYVARQASWWWPIYALFIRIPLNWIVFLAGKRVFAFAIPLYATSAALILLAAAAALPAGLSAAAARISPLRLIPPAGAAPEQARTASRLAPAFLWSWAVVPPLVVWILDVIESHKVVEIYRYLIATSPAIYLLAGLGLSTFWNHQLPRRQQANRGEIGSRPGAAEPGDSLPDRVPLWRRLAPASAVQWLLLTHVAFALINNAAAHVVPQREPWREMAALVEAQCHPDDLLLVSQYYDIVCLDRYLSRPMRQLGVSPALGREHLDKVLGGKDRFWLLTAQEGEALKDMIPPPYRLIKQFDLHHALHLRLYEAPSRR